MFDEANSVYYYSIDSFDTCRYLAEI